VACQTACIMFCATVPCHIFRHVDTKPANTMHDNFNLLACMPRLSTGSAEHNDPKSETNASQRKRRAIKSGEHSACAKLQPCHVHCHMSSLPSPVQATWAHNRPTCRLNHALMHPSSCILRQPSWHTVVCALCHACQPRKLCNDTRSRLCKFAEQGVTTVNIMASFCYTRSGPPARPKPGHAV